jgi:heat shock protein HtpX
MNLLQQQAANRRRTWGVMVVFVVFLAVCGAGLDLLVIGGGQFYVPVATLTAVVIGFLSAWWSLVGGDRAVLASANAEPVETCIANASSDDDRLRYTQFANIVQEMAIAAGLPPPKAYIIPDDDPNAFATGRDPAHASIAATRGLLRSLNREELQGVVAHEMSHVRNYDTRLMLVIAALIGAIVLLADWSARSMRFGGLRGSRRGGKNAGVLVVVVLVIWLVAIVVAPLVARLLALSVSRTREYLADASGAELTRNPMGLASALRKIDGATAPTQAIKRGTAHLCIADPEGGQPGARGRWSSLWATHPPIAKRVAALEGMAYHGQPSASLTSTTPSV